MTLTEAQQAKLEAPFKLEEHRIDPSGNVYIDKAAIRRRLSQVDPGWSQTPPLVVSQTPNTVTLSATLTIAGSTRSASGVAIINRWKKVDGKKVELVDYDLCRAERLAYKSADADILPRCAQQFNVGVYLKVDAIKNVKTEAALKDFLAKLTPAPVAAHWADNGGRQRVAAFLAKVGLEWAAIKDIVEPGKVLALLNETTLDEAAFMVRLAEIAFKPAAPQTPPPAPTTTTPARYGEASATTSTPVAPAIASAQVEDLGAWFPESSKSAVPASPDPLNKVYGNPYARRPVVRSVADPTGRNTRIGYIKCLPVDLGIHDIILTADGPRTIIAAYPPEHGDRRFLLKDAAGEEHDYKLTLSLGNAEIVGGPKLAAVQDDPALAPMSGPHRLWAGKQKAKVS